MIRRALYRILSHPWGYRLTCFGMLFGIVLTSPGLRAAELSEDDVLGSPCRTYLSAYGTPAFSAFLEVVVARLSRNPRAERFGSACNIGDYVRVECRAHPNDDVRRALDRLERAAAVGHLPAIPMCGA